MAVATVLDSEDLEYVHHGRKSSRMVLAVRHRRFHMVGKQSSIMIKD